MLAVCGKGGRGSKGDTLPLIKDGRRPGCEEDLFLPRTCVEWLIEGREAFGILLVLGADIKGSTGEDEAVGGAEAFERRKWIVPCIGDALIKLSWLAVKCSWLVEAQLSERPNNEDSPRGRGETKVDVGDWGNVPETLFRGVPCEPPSVVGEGRGGNG